jgi:hypothetical protein
MRGDSPCPGNRLSRRARANAAVSGNVIVDIIVKYMFDIREPGSAPGSGPTCTTVTARPRF